MRTLTEAVNRVLNILDDSESEVWTRDRIAQYVQDGYDQFCRDTQCLFDIVVLENLSPIGNFSSQMEESLAKEVGLPTTGQINFTAEFERDLAPAGAVGPVKATAPSDRSWLATFGLTLNALPAPLPSSTVVVERAFHNYLPLVAEEGYNLRSNDRHFQTRGGRASVFTVGADGLLTLRRVPSGLPSADYDDVTNLWGTVRSESSFTGITQGERGVLRDDPETFPSGGPWGIPRRLHPDENNTVVFLKRVGKPLVSNPFEIPDQYVEYVVYWVMHRALRMDSPGQDIKFSEHCLERYQLGVNSMKTLLNRINVERVGSLGKGLGSRPAFGLGNPQLPWEYGRNVSIGGCY